MENYFDDDLLETFAETFYGYGDYNAPYWFIGMEEGGGDSFENVERRLSIWDADNRPELEDIARYHCALGLEKFFTINNSKPTKLQPTWNKLIRVLLSIKEQRDIQTEQIREYQRTLLGKVSEGENCLLELFPLPSPSTADWMYEQHSKLPQLISRKEYKNCYRDRRTRHIRERIDQYRPKVIIFYSTTKEFIEQWIQIANTPFSFDETRKIYTAQKDEMFFAIIDHPARRWGNKYFHAVGQWIATELATNNPT